MRDSGPRSSGISKRHQARKRGRAAYGRGDWAAAYDALSRADEASPLEVADLERLAWSAALIGRNDDLLRHLERLHQAHLAAGDVSRAARAAFWIGLRLLSLGEPARAGGWLARCQRLLDGLGDCAEQGYVLLPAAHGSIAAGDFESALNIATRAAAFGDRFGDPDLSAFARNLQGRALLNLGRVRDGLALIDEAMLAASAGELSPLMTGLVYCSAIADCHKLYAVERAREWTASLAAWCDAQDQPTIFTGICLVHRAEIMAMNGAWPEAVAEAERAAGALSRQSDPAAIAAAFYQQGEIHRLRGESEAAEEAYKAASVAGIEPQPGLALLRLAQGRPAMAVAAIRRVLATAREPLQRARFLPAAVEILLESGDLGGADAAAGELEETAAGFDVDILAALAAHARGAVALRQGEPVAALEPLRQALAVWLRVGAPYLAARIRMEIGAACRKLGDEEGAGLEFDAAAAVFERLAAAPDLGRLERLRATSEEHVPERMAPPHGLTRREVEVLALVSAGHTNKGIARLLALSEKTVDRHVSNILAKLDVPSRAAATAAAYRLGLIDRIER